MYKAEEEDPQMDTETTRRLRELEVEGFTRIPGFLDAATLAEVRAGLERELGSHKGRNNFEGEKTERVYTLVARGEVFERVTEDARIMALLDALFQPNYLLTATQAICIHPGETPQPFHADDSFYAVPRPRPMISLTAIVAVDPFTAENGATEYIPRSHLWSDDEVQGTYLLDDGAANDTNEKRLAAMTVRAIMAPGDCIVFAGTIVHRGGANHSQAARLGFTNQYCAPWARTQENFYLGIPPEKIRQMSPKLQSLLGYSIHPPFMGQVTARHPLKTLEPDYVCPVA